MRRLAASFWVTNISKMNVSLRDLGLTIPAGRSMNLLDSRHHHFSHEELIKSAENGSLYTKRNKVVVRKVPPIVEQPLVFKEVSADCITSRRKSAIEVQEIRYEELELPDDVYAEQAADLTDSDYTPKE